MIIKTNQIRQYDWGKVSLPQEVRQELNIRQGCPFHIMYDKEKGQVILQKVGGKCCENNQT